MAEKHVCCEFVMLLHNWINSDETGSSSHSDFNRFSTMKVTLLLSKYVNNTQIMCHC